MSTLFRLMDAINDERFDFVDDMTDEEVKEVAPFVLLGWMHGANDNESIHTIMTDTYCNPYIFSLSKHPRLLLKLFVYANGDIDNTRYKFKKPKQGTAHSKTMKYIAQYYGCSLKDAADYANILEEGDIKEITNIMKETDAND